MNKYGVYFNSQVPFDVEADYFTKAGEDYVFIKESPNLSDPLAPHVLEEVALVRNPLVILKLNS